MKPARVVPFLILVLVLSLASGCGLFQKETAPAPAESQTEAGKTNTAETSTPTTLGRYYDFDDVQVPASLKLDKDKSILFKVGDFKAGVLVLHDNLDMESLADWFVESMARDNWVLKSAFKYPQAALFFAKKGKACIIHITEHTFSTEVAIWVVPAL